jgi:hypothetical protein
MHGATMKKKVKLQLNALLQRSDITVQQKQKRPVHARFVIALKSEEICW